MAAGNPGKQKGGRPAAKNKKNRLKPAIAILLGAGFLFLAAWFLVPRTITPDPAAPGGDGQSPESSSVAAGKKQDFQNLVGRWIRTDGGYVIDIKGVDADGNMEAGYYNPRPINVSRAEATWTRGDPEVFIELQDQGYPGSTYTLTYDRSKGALSGLYYQAAMGQEFDVVFVRME